MDRAPRRAVVVVVAVVLCAPVLACEPPPQGRTERSELLGGITRTYGTWAVDIDRDGDEDLLVNNHGFTGSGLWFNDGGGSLRDHGAVFRPYRYVGQWNVDRHDCDVADADGNGLLDVYCTAGSTRGTDTKDVPYESNELLLQQPDGTFLNSADAWGVTEPTSRGRDVAFVHANGDAYPDLVTTADRRDDGLKSETVVYLNDGGRRFVARGPSGLPRWGLVRCLEKADWNADGSTDLVVCLLDGGVRLYQGTGTGGFSDVTSLRRAGPTSTSTWAAAVVDLNGDGYADLVRSDTTAVSVRLWRPATGTFAEVQSIPQRDAKDVALGRYDDDEHLDLYILNRGCSTCDPVVNHPDEIHLGDGRGRFTFSERIESEGVGDFVSAWYPDASGRARWIVGNGNGQPPGPLEVFTWVVD